MALKDNAAKEGAWRLLPRPLAERLAESGVSDLYFSRRDYSERLDQFIARAKHSIAVVVVNFQLASEKGDLHGVLQSKMQGNPDFLVRLSLLNPNSVAVGVLADQLGISPEQLRADLIHALDDLLRLRSSLSAEQQTRFGLLTHDGLPFGSAFMLDATPAHGIIHVETKLYGVPRKDSIGYRVVAPSEFYTRNFEAWAAILANSTSV
jgi:hypothetical protein